MQGITRRGLTAGFSVMVAARAARAEPSALEAAARTEGTVTW
jgi:hypothetical protein